MKKLFLLTAAFSVIMSFNAFAFTSSNPDVTIKSGDTGRTYTWNRDNHAGYYKRCCFKYE